MHFRLLALVAVLSSFSMVACSEDSDPEGEIPMCEGYPDGPTGYSKGSLIPNFVLEGFPDLSATETSQVALCDYYDPAKEKDAKLLWVALSSLWCGPCRAEATLRKDVCGEMKAEGVACYTTILEGASRGTNATMPDMKSWHNQYLVEGATVLDPGGGKWGKLLPAASIPGNVLVDLRTMKIVYSEVGAMPTADAMKTWLRGYLK